MLRTRKMVKNACDEKPVERIHESPSQEEVVALDSTTETS